MKEIMGVYKSYHYDTSFVSDGCRTICVFAITSHGEMVDIRSEVLPRKANAADEEAAIHTRIQAHIDTLVRDRGLD